MATERAASSGVIERASAASNTRPIASPMPSTNCVEALPAEVVELAVDVDQPAGVRDEVGRVEDVPVGEHVGERVARQHVVRRPADDLAAQLADRRPD